MTDKSLEPQPERTDGAAIETTLESWKEIAAYLQRDVRTVTRWEKSEGLPVHRHLHRSRSSVYAYPSQLDGWRAGREPSAEPMPEFRFWDPNHAFAIVLIAAVSLLSVGTGRWAGTAGAEGVPAQDERPQFRQVIAGTALPHEGGKPSPDGGKFAFVSQGSLWVAPVKRDERSLRTGAPVRLTEPMDAWDRGGVAIGWSHDGRWIAFRTLGKDQRSDIYVIPASGGKPQQVSSAENPLNFWHHRIALSPTGDKIYFADGGGTRAKIYETSIGTNERRLLTGGDSGQPAVSPDGAWLTYLKVDSGALAPRSLWVQPVSGGDPILVCEALPGGFLRSPVWSPDGGRIALLVKSPDSDLWECAEIWMVPMGPGGHPSGEPEKFPLRTNTSYPIAGWTEQNEIALLFEGPGNTGLYVVPAEGGQAVQITDRWSTWPRWTPDGRTVYFRADAADADWGIFRIPAEGGTRTELSFHGEVLGIPIPGGGPVLSPDGRRLCFSGVSKGESENPFPTALYVVDSLGGGVPIPLMEPGSGGRAPTWSPDGKSIAFTRGPHVIDQGGGKGGLFIMSAAGGEPRQISTADDQVEGSSADWSPDGGLIAYLGRDNTLRVIPAEGGPSRVLASDIGPVRGHGVAWSPDGQQIAFTAGDRIWKIARAGGEPSEIRVALRGTPGQIDWSPDGQRLVLGFNGGRATELWLMTGFQD